MKNFEVPENRNLLEQVEQARFADPEGKDAKRGPGRPKKAPQDKLPETGKQAFLHEDEQRTTFIMQIDLVERLRNYAYTQRLSMREVIDKALTSYLDKEEKRLAKNGIEILKNPKPIKRSK